MLSYKVIFFQLILIIGLLSPTGYLFGSQQNSNNGCSIIPMPQKVIISNGNFNLNTKTKILYHKSATKFMALDLQNKLKNEFSLSTKIFHSSTCKTVTNTIDLQLLDGFSEESYKIKITSKNIICQATTETGLFYAIQSLLQSFRKENNKLIIPCMLIEDSPRFEWRGYMLDESRHFFGKKVVMQYLDIMAKLKLNRFHWHLSDEPGWRIEIKKYPLLTQIGAIGCWDDSKAARAFYTQEDIKEIVEYANQRHIMIIPEIDMPGHANAATRSYPELSGGGTGRWNGFTFHPTKETTYEFIDNLLTEIATLFPSPYIHIGGDEVHYGNQSWFTDQTIQSFIKEHDLKNEIGLEHYFIKRIAKIVKSKGKVMLGWDELVNVGLIPDETLVMWWRHDKPELLKQALEEGYKVVLTPRLPCYFDFVQDESHKIGRRTSEGNHNDLPSVYEFPDSPLHVLNIIKGHENQVLGLQANLWTEVVKDKKRLDFMTFPRLVAIAEAGWTKPKGKSYTNFEDRLKLFMQYLTKEGIYYFDIFNKTSTPEPWGPSKADIIAEG